METLLLPLVAVRLEVRRVNPSDAADLVVAAQRGDPGAFAQLYERFAAMVHGILLSHVKEREVPDLFQDVFLSALRSLGSLKEPENVGAWLASIARNRARDWQRSPGRQAESLDGTLDPPDPRAQADADPGDPEEARRALETIRALPEAYRETLVLRLVEGLSGPEIAERCGLTHGSVRVNLHRGMKLLRERLELARKGSQGSP